MESRAKTAGIVFLIITVVWSLVIWSFSLKNAESSTVDSNAAKSAIECKPKEFRLWWLALCGTAMRCFMMHYTCRENFCTIYRPSPGV